MVENNTHEGFSNEDGDGAVAPIEIGAVFEGSGDDISLGIPPIETQTAEPAAETPAQAPAVPERRELTPTERFLATRTLMFIAPDVPPIEPRLFKRREEERRPVFPVAEYEESTVRRRTRRRADDDVRAAIDDPQNTVIKVRKPREVPVITEPQRVKGSTRLEAKKQRRRDGREAGRRRTVITESEFMARRESVERTMIVRSKNERIQIGVLEDGVLAEHYVARSQEGSLIGNVYLGRVQNVLPSMEAAFVDIGRGRNAVLYSGEVDWDAAETGNQPRKIENALKAGDQVLVQVTKDPVGHKGARLTSQISLPGRYLVYVPNGSMNGISRKLPDTERTRLKKILKEVLPDSAGVIVRTAAEGASEEQLTLDVTRLTKQWEAISAQVAGGQAPQLLHSEPDMLIKIVRDVFNEDFAKMVIAGAEAQSTITAYLQQVAPDLVERVERYEGNRDLFDEYRISEQIAKALDRKVWLPSGGSLVIDRTEAMTVIDVNTGKFVGSGGNLEETVTKNNLEAAEEIVRQLRLRDIGGIIVVDFIDMVLESNRDLVLRRMIECLSRDRTKHQVAEVTSLGLVQMTRKKLGLGLLESFSESCDVCAGRGVVVHHDPIEKHRTNQGEPRRRQSQQSPKTGSVAVVASQPAVPQPHAITDDAKNALAQIAASTIAPAAASTALKDSASPVASTESDARSNRPAQSSAALDAVLDAATVSGSSEATTAEATSTSLLTDDIEASASHSSRPARKQRASRRVSTSGASVASAVAAVPAVAAVAATESQTEPADAEPAAVPATAEPAAVTPELAAAEQAPVEQAAAKQAPIEHAQVEQAPVEALPLLDLPVIPKVERPNRVSAVDAEQLLGSVLDSLPEPPAHGSRARNRRVTTTQLRGGVVTGPDSE